MRVNPLTLVLSHQGRGYRSLKLSISLGLDAMLLVREAGGEVVDKHGAPSNLFTPSTIASSPRLIERFLTATEGLEWRK